MEKDLSAKVVTLSLMPGVRAQYIFSLPDNRGQYSIRGMECFLAILSNGSGVVVDVDIYGVMSPVRERPGFANLIPNTTRGTDLEEWIGLLGCGAGG